MGATLRAPIAGPFQISGTTGAVVNLDVHIDIEYDLALEAGPEVRPTQPPHPSLIVDVPSGYPEDLGTFSTPDTLDIEDIPSVDVTPLSSIAISGVDATPCSDMSVARSVSVGSGTSMSVDFDDRARKIYDTVAMPEIEDQPAGLGARPVSGIPSLAPNVRPTSLGDIASGGFPLTALGRYTDTDDSFAQDMYWTRASKRDRGVESDSDLSFTEFDSRSALDRYFAEKGIRRGSVAAASVDEQVGPRPWTLRRPSPTQGGPRTSSQPSQLPP